MELYVLAGGQLDSLNRWQQDLNAQFLPIYDKDGKHKKVDGVPQYRRLLVAPVQLFKICYNKENEQQVANMVLPEWSHVTGRYKILDKSVNFLRKMLGLKKAKKPTSIYPFTQPNAYDKAVFVVPIGTKPDAVDPNGEELI